MVQFTLIFYPGKVDRNITDIANPIMPTELVDWYFTTGSGILGQANPALRLDNVMNTCSNQSECMHDLIVRVNPVTSAATGRSLQTFQAARDTLGTDKSSSCLRLQTFL